MKIAGKINELFDEDVSLKETCNLCLECSLNVGQKTPYGAVVIYRIGTSFKDGWFATLSPKTGGNPEEDFTIQMMTFAHLTHFSQVASYPELAKNYGVAFSKISAAMAKVMAKENFKAASDSRSDALSIAVYGKCTTWKEKKEHLHLKLFPFKSNIGQPYTVDSSFERKEVHKDLVTGEEFVKMNPVRKVLINKEQFEKLSSALISLLNQ